MSSISRNRNAAEGTKQTFTLIELLVVIAIIAFLNAILFPAFARAGTCAAGELPEQLQLLGSSRCGQHQFSAFWRGEPLVRGWPCQVAVPKQHFAPAIRFEQRCGYPGRNRRHGHRHQSN